MCHTHAKHWMECAGRHCSNWVVKKCSIIPRFLISPPDPLLVHRRGGGMGEKRRLRTGDRKLYDWSIDKWWPIIFPVSSSLGANSKMILLCMSGRSSLLTSPLYSHHHHPAQHGLLYCSPGTHCLPCSFTLLFGWMGSDHWAQLLLLLFLFSAVVPLSKPSRSSASSSSSSSYNIRRRRRWPIQIIISRIILAVIFHRTLLLFLN